jgi:hypothetical protein
VDRLRKQLFELHSESALVQHSWEAAKFGKDGIGARLRI